MFLNSAFYLMGWREGAPLVEMRKEEWGGTDWASKGTFWVSHSFVSGQPHLPTWHGLVVGSQWATLTAKSTKDIDKFPSRLFLKDQTLLALRLLLSMTKQSTYSIKPVEKGNMAFSPERYSLDHGGKVLFPCWSWVAFLLNSSCRKIC